MCKELGALGAANKSLLEDKERLQDYVHTLPPQRQAEGSESVEEKEVGRLAMVAVPHACLCLHRALEHLTEREASASILASLSLAGRMCSLQNVFSIECVLYRLCSLYNVFSTECVLYRMCPLQNVSSIERVLYRMCPL